MFFFGGMSMITAVVLAIFGIIYFGFKGDK